MFSTVMCPVVRCLSIIEEREGVFRVAGWVDAWGRVVGVHPGGGMLVARGMGPQAGREVRPISTDRGT